MSETPTGYFQELWGSSADPWDHAGRWYERRKYDVTVAVLPKERYRHAVEAACGVGLLTERLAQRADAVTATDRYERAVEVTSRRCRSFPSVSVERRDVRDGPPSVAYDLGMLSEVLYYFDVGSVVDVLRRWYDGCDSGGHLVVAHYRPVVPEHVLTGDEVHVVARDLLGQPLVSVVDGEFRIDVFGAD